MKLKTLGRIALPIGLVLIAYSFFIWLVFSANKPLVFGVLGFGVALVALAIGVNIRNLPALGTGRGLFFLAVNTLGTAVLIVALVVGNYATIKKGKTWDVTKGQIHTLAPDTTSSLKNLKADLTVLAFYQGGDPNLEVAKEMLGRYQRESDKVKVEWVDPVREPGRAKKYGVRSSGSHRIVVLYSPPERGAAVPPTEQRVQELNEESLTNAIVKATRSAEKTLYFVAGHGEVDLDDTGAEGLSELKKRMETEGLLAKKLQLSTAETIPQDAAAVVLPGPKVELQPTEIEVLRRYAAQGGRLFVQIEPRVPSANLAGFLKELGVQADDALVVDPISRMFGASPIFPVVQQYGEGDIVRDFRLNTVFPTARPLTVLRDVMSVQVKPLALVLESAWADTNDQGPQFRRDDGEKVGPFPIAVTVTKDTKGEAAKRSDEARLVVAGDRDFATNQYRQAFGNEDFFLNCLNWMVEQTERITIRPRMREASRLYLTEADSTKLFVGTVTFPVLILIAGMWVWLARRTR